MLHRTASDNTVRDAFACSIPAKHPGLPVPRRKIGLEADFIVGSRRKETLSPIAPKCDLLLSLSSLSGTTFRQYTPIVAESSETVCFQRHNLHQYPIIDGLQLRRQLRDPAGKSQRNSVDIEHIETSDNSPMMCSHRIS